MKTIKHLPALILIAIILSFPVTFFTVSMVSASAGGDKPDTVNKNSAALTLKAVIDRAAAETDANAAVKIIQAACAQQESIETELVIFEFLFLTQKHGRYKDNFNEFVKLAGAHKDDYLKSHYQRIARLYSAFVNYALNRDELIIKNESAIKRTPAAKDKTDILRLLHNKYSAAFEAAKKDAAMRKTSPDFISYLEKKCADKKTDGGSPEAETAGDDFIVKAFKEMAADRRASKLIERRSLLLLMIYKNIRESADAFSSQLIIKLIKKNIAESIINLVIPEISAHITDR